MKHGSPTQLLHDLTGGNRAVADALLPLVYDELYAMAQRQLRSERANHTLSPTALVHEAYLRLIEQDRVTWQNRAHFCALAALAMRRILINYAKQRQAEKRGGGLANVTLEDEHTARTTRADELLALDEALERLEAMNERHAKVVVYRFFGGLTQEEIAEVLGVSVPTVRRDWRLARAWLSTALAGE
ncbi:MAG: sigma-70 family RNA polymerase sigma factor [Bacteroidota bacterium]